MQGRLGANLHVVARDQRYRLEVPRAQQEPQAAGSRLGVGLGAVPAQIGV